jgi:O-antigen ligase
VPLSFFNSCLRPAQGASWAKATAVVFAGLFLAFPISLALTSVLMVMFLVLWVLGGQWRDAMSRVRANPVALAALALWAVIVLGVLWTSAPREDVQLHLSKYSKLLFAVALMTFAVGVDTYRRALLGFVVAMLFILVSTWLNVWMVLPWSKTQVPGWGLSHHVVGDYITQNVMMALFTLLALFRAKSARAPAASAAWFAVAAMAAVSITHLSDGRTGYVLLFSVLFYLVTVSFRGKALWWSVMSALLVLCLAYASSSPMRERVAKAVDEIGHFQVDKYTSIGTRLYMYDITPDMIADKPLLGHGTGAYHTEICRYAVTPPSCQGWLNWHPHNQFLFFAADHGLLGLMAYLILLAAMAWVAYRTPDREAGVLLGGLTVLLVVDGMFNSPLWSSRESHLFFFMMGLLVPRALSAVRPVARSSGQGGLA